MPGFAAVPVAPALCAGLVAAPSPAPAAAVSPAAGCRAGPAGCHDLYTYGYTLGLHPFTEPDAVRRQLTDHFWLFPVSGGCAGRIRAGARCELPGPLGTARRAGADAQPSAGRELGGREADLYGVTRPTPRSGGSARPRRTP